MKRIIFLSERPLPLSIPLIHHENHASSHSSVIQIIRVGVLALMDSDIALDGIETRVLKQAVRRNRNVPDDFMFELTENEIVAMVSQNVIPNKSSLGGATPSFLRKRGLQC